MENPAPLILALLATACATATSTPVALTFARVAYARASAGPASQLAPTDLHEARTALDAAERSFVEEHASQKTIDLAHIADSAAATAEARAESVLADQAIAQAKQATLERAARQDAEAKAADSEERAAASDHEAKAANDALAKLDAKEDARGVVITLSGSLLFRPNEASLLPAALTPLNHVADVLMAKGRTVVIEGYTDSRGSQSRNMDLSQRRADSVRRYLVSRGFAGEKIAAKGMGPERPVAQNTSSHGRANNRRVEIVIANEPPQAN
jgi:outer membrane protein OmpA-like peptidoglycan-associated protein